jgi:hypothetical protein
MIKKYLLSILVCSFSLYAADEGQVQDPAQVLSEFFANPKETFAEGEKKNIKTIDYSFDEVETQKVQSADKYSDATTYRVSLSKKGAPITTESSRINNYTHYIAHFKRKIQGEACTVEKLTSAEQNDFNPFNLSKELSRKFLGYPTHGDLLRYNWNDNEVVRVIKKSGSFYDYRKSGAQPQAHTLALTGSYYQRKTWVPDLFLTKYQVIPCTTEVRGAEIKNNGWRNIDIPVSSQEITVAKKFKNDEIYHTYRPTIAGWATIAAAVATTGVYAYSWLRGSQTK